MKTLVPNLKRELLELRKKEVSDELLLEQVYSILKQNDDNRDIIKSNLSAESSTIANNFIFDKLDTELIFHEKQIQKICIDYRLRFLNSHLFNNKIPEEAISKINEIEKSHSITLSGYKIMAPSNAFTLKNYDDPLLFVPIGNNYYYLIHKWGNDLSWYRKFAVLPIKNIVNFVVFCFVTSLLITLAIPENNLSKSVSFAPVIIFLFMFKSIICSIAYYFFMMGKNFNNIIWNREFKEN